MTAYWWWIGTGVAAVVPAAAVWWLWWRLPKRQMRSITLGDPKARADIEDNFRKTIGQALGGIAVLLGRRERGCIEHPRLILISDRLLNFQSAAAREAVEVNS
jgi:hypothetical protein